MAQWVTRDWRNLPGPFYAVAGAYLYGAPATNVATCDHAAFVWRQPRDETELLALTRTITASVDGAAHLGKDGDQHWTLDAIRAWWVGREALARAYHDAGVLDVRTYFEDTVPAYLRAYAFYLEHRHRPRAGDALPDLDVPPTLHIGPPAGEFDGALELFARRDELVLSRVQPHELPLWGCGREVGDLNVPGVFAIAQTAPSSSHAWAPLNLCAGEHGTFVARQPRTADELERILDAATTEPLFGMCVEAWEPDQIRTWWRKRRSEFEHALRVAELPDVDAYLRELPRYLRALIFVVEEGRLPDREHELPALDDITTERYWETPRDDQLPFAANPDPSSFTNGRFAARHPLNVPGPFYGAQTDTCETGPMEAPSNVACGGEYWSEFVFRQPRNARELGAIERAAWADPFSGHACDGNQYWTPALVRAWWAARDTHLAAWRDADVPYADAMFERELPRYLRGYLFFLEHRRVPSPADRLPDLV